MVRNDRALRGEGTFWPQQQVNGLLERLLAFTVFRFKFRIGARNRNVCYNLDDLEEMVEGDNGLEHHKKRLGDPQHVPEWPSRLGLKVSNTVIPHISDGPSGERWEYQPGDCRNTKLREFFFKDGERIALGTMTWPSLENFIRLCEVKTHSATQSRLLSDSRK